MSRVCIELHTDSPPFEADFVGEVERVLADLASRVNPRIPGPYNLTDAEGVWCGEARIES